MAPDADNVYVSLFGTSQVGAFSVNANGSLSNVPGTPFGTGFGTPLSVQVDPDGGHLFATNHGGNRSIGVSTINANGSLTNITGSPFTMPATRNDPFAASVSPDGDNYYIPSENNNPGRGTRGRRRLERRRQRRRLVPPGDRLGHTRQPGESVRVGDHARRQLPLRLQPGGRRQRHDQLVPGQRQRHADPGRPGAQRSPGNHPLNMAVSPDGDHLYVATRASNTVNAYNINGNGTLTAIAGQPYATGGTNGKGIAITPDGKHVYVSNNLSDNISRFTVLANGALSLQGQTALPAPAPDGAETDLESIVITPEPGADGRRSRSPRASPASRPASTPRPRATAMATSPATTGTSATGRRSPTAGRSRTTSTTRPGPSRPG